MASDTSDDDDDDDGNSDEGVGARTLRHISQKAFRGDV